MQQPMQPRPNQFQPHPCNRKSSVYHGEQAAYGIDEAPLSIFENQVIPVNIHNLLNSFDLIWLQLGKQIIPKWNQYYRKRTFADFNNFRRKLKNRAFFVEGRPRIFMQCKEFRVQNYYVPPAEHTDINIEIDNYIEIIMSLQIRPKNVAGNYTTAIAQN